MTMMVFYTASIVVHRILVIFFVGVLKIERFILWLNSPHPTLWQTSASTCVGNNCWVVVWLPP